MTDQVSRAVEGPLDCTVVPPQAQHALAALRAYADWAGRPPVLTDAADELQAAAIALARLRTELLLVHAALRRLGSEKARHHWSDAKHRGMSYAYFAAATKLARALGIAAGRKTKRRGAKSALVKNADGTVNLPAGVVIEFQRHNVRAKRLP